MLYSEHATRWPRLKSIRLYAALVFFAGLFIFLFRVPSTQVTLGGTHDPSEKPNAFAVYLDVELAHEEEDHYFTSTRMLIYQLLYDPDTKTNTSIQFVVLVTAAVTQDKRARLVADGADVVEVDPLVFGWMTPGDVRWASVMQKLHVFKLTAYNKILLLDSDMVVVRRLDALFDSPEAQPKTNLKDPANIKDDEALQPSTYLFAANSGPYWDEHPYPALRGKDLNAGFVLLQPSLEMYNYYISVANIKDRFNSWAPEQNLWNYAHRRDGNMPWVQVDPDWTINHGLYNDFEHGVATFHGKYWRDTFDPKVKPLFLRSRYMMEGFWRGREGKFEIFRSEDVGSEDGGGV